jgi:transcription termination/antitermination protein NusA
VRQVVNELRGEKVDIVPFSSDGPEFVMRALAPAKVREVRLHEDTGIAEVIVPDFQLSLAIGKEGQNARLAARLTGWRVDIKSESQLAEEESGGGYAEGEWVEGPDGGLMWQPAEGGEAISAAEAGYATLGEGAPTDGATADGAPAEGTTSDGSPDSPDAGEQIAVAPEETAMHVEASVADEAADEIAADADLGTAEADIRTEANQEIEETETPETETVEES